MSRRAPTLSQQEFLRRAKEQLDLGWDQLAVLTCIAPRALKSYRMPDGSKDHRSMPPLAWRAVEEATKTPRTPVVPQQQLLLAVMDAYGLTLPEIAELIGAKPRTMTNWMRSDELASYRGMPPLARAAL